MNTSDGKYKIIVDKEKKIYLISSGEEKGIKRTDSVALIKDGHKVFDYKKIAPSWSEFLWRDCEFRYSGGVVSLPGPDCPKVKAGESFRFAPLSLLHEIDHALWDNCGEKPCEKDMPLKGTTTHYEFEKAAWLGAFKMLEKEAKSIWKVMGYEPEEMIEYASEKISISPKGQRKEIKEKSLKIFAEWFSSKEKKSMA